MGCDAPKPTGAFFNGLFQSTHPSWGATFSESLSKSHRLYFNPRTHRGVRHTRYCVYVKHINISIHAPIVGCDAKTQSRLSTARNFNPRTHRGVRPFAVKEGAKLQDISIHAPIVGCDIPVRILACNAVYFNPRTHRGVRQFFSHKKYLRLIISIHAPIVGCDLSKRLSWMHL